MTAAAATAMPGGRWGRTECTSYSRKTIRADCPPMPASFGPTEKGWSASTHTAMTARCSAQSVRSPSPMVASTARQPKIDSSESFAPTASREYTSRMPVAGWRSITSSSATRGLEGSPGPMSRAASHSTIPVTPWERRGATTTVTAITTCTWRPRGPVRRTARTGSCATTRAAVLPTSPTPCSGIRIRPMAPSGATTTTTADSTST